ncbi:autotransporter outer membrane beta-barrel domain-containing protein [Citrobacter koseri]|uniref:autotransporter outer membrane beta-barrel domain-containing protein n=1 Tax=Citrobacter koseri TaxID=545 RepID=UPI0029430808|nr:autotransporter outer membrane beta-barrel domain-containing protein [Citrobacter koseri]WOJ30916.1 autotransporter outer membrane beta-barrel domain-containing protein [Citrobacter koseri]WOJ35090.1 autotransporter outer membrane beta-barrel domain-containing protein [Citrobacter koseri]
MSVKSVAIHTERFTNDMSGLTGKYGFGVNANLIRNLDAYGEFNYAKGNKFETPYSGTLGVRYSF